MTAITVADGCLRIEMLGWDKIWALKSRLVLPLAQIAGGRPWEEGRDARWPKGVKWPGTHFPGVLVAGTYVWFGGRTFYAVHHFAHALVIDVQDGVYTQVVVEVESPAETLEILRQAGIRGVS